MFTEEHCRLPRERPRMDHEKRYCPFCGSRLVTRHDEGVDRLWCGPEGRFVYENPIPAATALITDQTGRFLLVLRGCEPGAGRWALPGGFVENGETPAEAAARELEEETGLRAEGAVLVDVLHHFSDFYGTSLIIIGYAFGSHEGEPVPGDDAVDARFFEAGDLPPVAFESHRRLIERFRDGD